MILAVSWSRLVPATLLLLVGLWALALGLPGRVVAHGETAISVQPLVLEPDAEMTVTLEGFDENGEVRIAVVGVSGRVELGTVTTDDEGSFTLEMVLPHDLAPGAYTVTAAGADDKAGAEVTVVAAHGEPAAHADSAAGEAHLDDVLQGRPYGAGEIAGIAAGIAVAVLVGLALVLWPVRRRAAEREHAR